MVVGHLEANALSIQLYVLCLQTASLYHRMEQTMNHRLLSEITV